MASRTLLDGTEVLFYLSAAGDKYCAYIPAGTERLIRFTYESNVYTEDYGISLYENVLGTSGFRIECPRGAAYYANDYYYFDEDGTLWLLARCSSEALEVDLNSDGQKELLCSYHGYELYYDTMIGGQLYEADLCDLTAQQAHTAHIGLLHIQVPDHRQGAVLSHGGAHVQFAVRPQGQIHLGVIHGPADIALVVGHRQQRPQGAAALDLQRHAGPVLLQGVAHHGSGRQCPPQSRRGHRQRLVDLPRPLCKVSGRDRHCLYTAITGDGPDQLIAHLTNSCCFMN